MSGGSQKTGGVSSYTPYALGDLQSVLSGAQSVAASHSTWNPETATRIADQDPMQAQAYQQIQSMQGRYSGDIDQALASARAAGTPISEADINAYMNPYTSSVIDATMARARQDQGAQMASLVGNQSAQNALGGSRAQLQRAMAAGQFALSNNQTVAGLNQNNYAQAVAAAQAAKGLQLQSAYGQGNLAQTGQAYGLQDASALYGAGQSRQAYQQSLLDAYKSNATSQYMWPVQMQQWLAGITGTIAPQMGGTTVSESETTEQPGSMQYLGAALAAMSAFSDKRLKENERVVGETFDGQPIYAFNYKGDKVTQLGLMAQDVEKTHPEAVGEVGGFKTVQYDLATRDAEREAPGRAGGGAVFASTPFQGGGDPWGSILANAPRASAAPSIPQAAHAGQPRDSLGSIKQWSELGKGAGEGASKGMKQLGAWSERMAQSRGEGGWGAAQETTGGDTASNASAVYENLASLFGGGGNYALGGAVDDPWGGMLSAPMATSAPVHIPQTAAPPQRRGALNDMKQWTQLGSKSGLKPPSMQSMATDPQGSLGQMKPGAKSGGIDFLKGNFGPGSSGPAGGSAAPATTAAPTPAQGMGPAGGGGGGTGGVGGFEGFAGSEGFGAAEGFGGAGEGMASAGEAATGIGEGAAAAGEGAAAAGEGMAAMGEGAAAAGEGMAGAFEGLASLFSDKRLKENRRRIGRLFDGQPVYAYNYKGDPVTRLGLMAQDVEKVRPEAVGKSNGFKTVQYDKAVQGAIRRADGGSADTLTLQDLYAGAPLGELKDLARTYDPVAYDTRMAKYDRIPPLPEQRPDMPELARPPLPERGWRDAPTDGAPYNDYRNVAEALRAIAQSPKLTEEPAPPLPERKGAVPWAGTYIHDSDKFNREVLASRLMESTGPGSRIESDESFKRLGGGDAYMGYLLSMAAAGDDDATNAVRAIANGEAKISARDMALSMRRANGGRALNRPDGGATDADMLFGDMPTEPYDPERGWSYTPHDQLSSVNPYAYRPVKVGPYDGVDARAAYDSMHMNDLPPVAGVQPQPSQPQTMPPMAGGNAATTPQAFGNMPPVAGVQPQPSQPQTMPPLAGGNAITETRTWTPNVVNPEYGAASLRPQPSNAGPDVMDVGRREIEKVRNQWLGTPEGARAAIRDTLTGAGTATAEFSSNLWNAVKSAIPEGDSLTPEQAAEVRREIAARPGMLESLAPYAVQGAQSVAAGWDRVKNAVTGADALTPEQAAQSRYERALETGVPTHEQLTQGGPGFMDRARDALGLPPSLTPEQAAQSRYERALEGGLPTHERLVGAQADEPAPMFTQGMREPGPRGARGAGITEGLGRKGFGQSANALAPYVAQGASLAGRALDAARARYDDTVGPALAAGPSGLVRAFSGPGAPEEYGPPAPPAESAEPGFWSREALIKRIFPTMTGGEPEEYGPPAPNVTTVAKTPDTTGAFADSDPNRLYGSTPSDMSATAVKTFRVDPNQPAAEPPDAHPYGVGAASPRADSEEPNPYGGYEAPPMTARLGLEGNLRTASKDRDGSISVGRYGLNTKFGSARDFVRDFGADVGMDPDLDPASEPQEFLRQWDTAAKSNPQALMGAEDKWHQKYVSGAVKAHIVHAGLPTYVADDPRVKEYFQDRMLPHGTDISRNPNGRNGKNRIINAWANADGDIPTFLKNMTDIDKAHVQHDFRGYLADQPENLPGLINRMDARLNGALGRGVKSQDMKTGAVTQSIEAREAAANAPKRNADLNAGEQKQVGLIKKVLGGWNPLEAITGPGPDGPGTDLLGFSPEQRRNLMIAGLSMMGGSPLGWRGAGAGAQGLMNAQQMAMREQQMGVERAKLALEALSQPKWAAYHEVDPLTGVQRTGLYNVHTGERQNPGSLGTSAGASPQDVTAMLQERAKRVALGMEPMPTNVRTDPQALIIQKMVRELNPNYHTNMYDYRKAYEAPGGVLEKQRNSFNTAVGHAEIIQDLANRVGTHGTTTGNAIHNTIKRQFGDDALQSYENSAKMFAGELERASAGGITSAAERTDAEGRVSSNKPAHTIRSGNAANVELMVHKMLSGTGAWDTNMAGAPAPDPMTPQSREVARRIFAQEPDPAIKAARAARLSRDPRTADLVSAPAGARREGAAAPALRSPEVERADAQSAIQQAIASGKAHIVPKIIERARQRGVVGLEAQ